MALKVNNSGELKLMQWALKDGTGLPDLTLKLYKNDYTPVDGSVASDFTAADFTGYSDKSLARGTWTDATTNGNGKAEMSYTAQSWDASSSQTVYGYYIVSDDTSGDLIAESCHVGDD